MNPLQRDWIRGVATLLFATTLWLPLLLTPRPVLAQSGPLVITVGTATGGAADRIARLMTVPLRNSLGRPVVVMNRLGDGGNAAAEEFQSARADGSQLLMVPIHSEKSGVAPAVVRGRLNNLVPIAVTGVGTLTYGFFAQAGTPTAVTQNLERAVVAALNSPGVRQTIELGKGSPTPSAGSAGLAQAIAAANEGYSPASNAAIASAGQQGLPDSAGASPPPAAGAYQPQTPITRPKPTAPSSAGIYAPPTTAPARRPESAQAQQSAEQLFATADRLLGEGNLHEARETAKTLISRYPNHPLAQRARDGLRELPESLPTRPGVAGPVATTRQGAGDDKFMITGGCFYYEKHIDLKTFPELATGWTWSGQCKPGQPVSGRGSVTHRQQDVRQRLTGSFVNGYKHGLFISETWILNTKEDPVQLTYNMGCGTVIAGCTPATASGAPAAASGSGRPAAMAAAKPAPERETAAPSGVRPPAHIPQGNTPGRPSGGFVVPDDRAERARKKAEADKEARRLREERAKTIAQRQAEKDAIESKRREKAVGRIQEENDKRARERIARRDHLVALERRRDSISWRREFIDKCPHIVLRNNTDADLEVAYTYSGPVFGNEGQHGWKTLVYAGREHSEQLPSLDCVGKATVLTVNWRAPELQILNKPHY